MRTGGVGVLIELHGKPEPAALLPQQAGDGLHPLKPGVAVPNQGVGWDLSVLLAELREGDAGAVGKAAELLEVQLPAHGRAAEGAVDAPDGIAHGALHVEGSEGVLQKARGAHGRVGEVALPVVPLLQHGAADAVWVRQKARGEKDVALAVHVHGGERVAHAGAQGDGGGGFQSHAALQALKLGEVGVGLVEGVEVAGYLLQLREVVVYLRVVHKVGVVLHLVETLGADEILVEEVVETVREENPAARLGKGGYLILEALGLFGADDALIRVEQVVVLQAVLARDVHGLGLEA